MGAKPRILAIDDDKTLSRMIAMIFQKAGFEVFTAANGAEGLAKAEKIKPDLVILDVMMPDMSGLDVCQRLRANPVTALMPIIMLSARGNVDDKVSGFKAGADDYVQKPVAPKELLARTHALLQRARRTKAPKAKTIAVVGAKGGVGVTTVAVNLAANLNHLGHSVVLAELRPYHGTLAHQLKLTPAQDLASLLAMPPEDITRSEVIRRVVRHPSGLRALSAPQQATNYALTAGHVEAIVEPLQNEAGFLILDLPIVSGEAMYQAVGYADQILLLTEPEALSVACAKADLDTLKAWGVYDQTGVVLVVRSRANTQMKPADVEKQLGVRLAGIIPPAPEIFYVAASAGNPVVLARPEELASAALVKLTRLVEAV